MKIDINGCFDQGWTDLPPAGNLTNQQPENWHVSWIEPGQPLYGATDLARGVPECVHKLNTQLPPDEQFGGPDSLILCHDEAMAITEPAVYKIFHAGAAFGAELRQTITGLKPGSTAVISVPIRVHRKQDTGDPYATEFMLLTNGRGTWWNGDKLPDREWAYRVRRQEIRSDGMLEIIIQVKSKWDLPVDFFFDGITVDAELADTEQPVPPPIDHEHPDLQVQIDTLAEWNQEQDATIAILESRITALENKPPPGTAVPPPPPGSIIIDVSAWNDTVNWNTIDCAGAIVRTSNGMGSPSTDGNGVDKMLWSHLDGLARTERPFGLYHFYNARSGLNQINLFMSIVEDAIGRGHRPTMGLWLDFEDGSPDNESVILSAFNELNRQNTTGQPIGVYSRASWWNPRVERGHSWPCDLMLRNWTAAWVSDKPLDFPPSVNTPFAGMHHWAKNKTTIWQFTSKGGNIVGHNKDSLDVGYWYGGDYWDCDGELPGETVDMLQYFQPPNGRTYGDITIKSNDVRQQLQFHNDEYFVTKGVEFEKRTLVDGIIYYVLDDSRGNNEYHTVNSTTGWIPRFMQVGERFHRQEDVNIYRKSDCQPTGASSHWTNEIVFVELIDTWESPAAVGLTFQNVAHLQWIQDGIVEEDYWLAPGVGYVGWRNRWGNESWVKEFIPVGHQGNNTFAGSCYQTAFGEEWPA